MRIGAELRLCFFIISGLREVIKTRPTLTLKMNDRIRVIVNVFLLLVLSIMIRNFGIIKDIYT